MKINSHFDEFYRDDEHWILYQKILVYIKDTFFIRKW